MTSRKTDKKLELKVKRVLKTSVRGGVVKYPGEVVASSAVVQTLAESEEGQSAIASSKRPASCAS